MMKPFELDSNTDGITPLDDISGLNLTWINNKAQLDAAEADNVRNAIQKYLGKRHYSFPSWFTVEHINQIHKQMFGTVWVWAGKYRHSEKSIGIKSYQIPEEMFKLERDIDFWSQDKKLNPIEISARVHHRLVWIHPYENGNGRHGRLVGDLILKSLGYSYAKWPNLADQGQARLHYLSVLKEADRGDFNSLVLFLVQHNVKAT